MTSVHIWIPGLPVAKGRPIVSTISGHARMRTPTKTVRYEGLVAHAASIAMAGGVPLRVPLSVLVDVRLPAPASWSNRKRARAHADLVMPTVKPDLDNYLKSVLDGMNGIVYEDDSLVCDLSTQKRYRPEIGIMVIVSTIPATERAR